MRSIVITFTVAVVVALTLGVASQASAYCALENPLTGGCLIEGM